MPDSDFSLLLGALDFAVFRREGEDLFTSLGTVPAWAEPILSPAGGEGTVRLGEHSFFLEHFLFDAEAFWSGGTDGTLPSCSWSEPAVGGQVTSFQATALSQGGRQFMVIAPAGKVFAEHRTILQQARQGQLEHEGLIKEVEKKEVLVHCIVHDLANPLAGIVGVLGLLESEPLTAPGQRMLQLAREACARQQGLIQQILDVFRSEHQALESGDLDPRHAPDLLETARASIEHAEPFCQRREVRLRLEIEGDAGQPWPVLGERSRLERIFGNLIENAYRHTPRASEVTVRLLARGEEAEVRIEDAGGGVPEEAIPHLFKKLASSRTGKAGKAGLGLYFCRITVERWSGEIGYSRTERGSACFWFRLKRLISADAPR